MLGHHTLDRTPSSGPRTRGRRTNRTGSNPRGSATNGRTIANDQQCCERPLAAAAASMSASWINGPRHDGDGSVPPHAVRIAEGRGRTPERRPPRAWSCPRRDDDDSTGRRRGAVTPAPQRRATAHCRPPAGPCVRGRPPGPPMPHHHARRAPRPPPAPAASPAPGPPRQRQRLQKSPVLPGRKRRPPTRSCAFFSR